MSALITLPAPKAPPPAERKKPGRKSEMERAKIQFGNERHRKRMEMLTIQEEKRAPQFQIDQKGTLWILMGLAAFTFVGTAALTADGTIGSAVSARFAFEWMGFLLFAAFEVAILAFMLMYYILGSRIDYDGNRVKSGHWFAAMVVASSLTVGLGIYHVFDMYGYEWLNVDMWVGIGIRLSVAVFFVLVSKGIASVLFAKSITADGA